MEPGIDNDWLTCKNDVVEEVSMVGNIARSWQWRETGIDPQNYPSNRTVLENIAEDILVQKTLKTRCCDLPGYPRSTFLMVFSPDGTKVASTHGNHNVYVSELASGKHVRILKGHPRTPWCIAFHPSHTQLIGSGCLGGQVRVWDISSGGSEVWNVQNETVIASIAFHPRDQLLVIATYNELYFWDWSRPVPFTRVSTNNICEKVRYVAFDALGYKLVTGISLSVNSSVNSAVLQQTPVIGPINPQNSSRRDDNDDNSGTNRNQENSGSTQDMIVNSYQNLVQRYDSLVRNYQRLFMVRHRLTNTPPPPNTTDRGTDPMDTDTSLSSPGPSSWSRPPRTSTPGALQDASPVAETSRRTDNVNDADAENSSSRLLNLDVLSFDSNPTRNETSTYLSEHSIFGSRSSAFQPLTEGRSFRTVDQSERATRLLPNPFSSTGSARSNRIPFLEDLPQTSSNSTNSSRTSIFTSSRPESALGRNYLQRRRNSSPSQNSPQRLFFSDNAFSSSLRNSSNPEANAMSQTSTPPSTSNTNVSQRPSMTNSSTQMSPGSNAQTSLDAQTINESLDLIRDILRDSGTRLLNLITNMSLSTLANVANVERNIHRRGSNSRAQSDDSEGSGLSRGTRPRVRLLSSNMRRTILSSSSDSDSDQSLEVNIFRTRNSTFSNDNSRNNTRPSTSATSDRTHTTDRMIFELNDNPRIVENSRDTGGINVTLSNNRFRVRTQTNTNMQTDAVPSARVDVEIHPEPGPSNRGNQPNDEAGLPNSVPEFNTNRPSTSRGEEGIFARSPVLPPQEAYRKVRSGVNLLQKHTMHLTDLWLRGNRVSMRELRVLWDNLRRRILVLHRESGRQDLPGQYYTRSLLDRCMMLTEMSDVSRNTNRQTRHTRGVGNDRHTEENNQNSGENTGNSNSNDSETSNFNSNSNEMRRTATTRNAQTRSTNIRSSPSLRRRLQSSYRWRPEDEMRRRTRNATSNRLAARFTNRSRRDFARAIEISTTRHEIRMRAMQVLSIMFNMMMMCLEERGLSLLIINMLRTLKKALALTCLMLMMNRNFGRPSNPSCSASRIDSLNVVRIQNDEHLGPVNVDGTDETLSVPPTMTSETAENSVNQVTATGEQPKPPSFPSTSHENNTQTEQSTTNLATQRWSNRLAVQIAAANRNNSATARSRRELYLESRRLKALHRTNPILHPLIKKRVLPPVTNHRIPALRSLPSRLKKLKQSTQSNDAISEPVAGPSTENNSATDSVNQDTPRDETLNEFEQRINLIRLAHLQAVRLRNAARTRFRRLQTIRLYTPSSVREMFELQSNNADNAAGNRSPLQNGPEFGNRRSFASYRPHILTPRSEAASRIADEPSHFHTVLNNVAMPLMQVNESPSNSEPQQSSQPQRLPRIHEYLQPILLAQNAAMIVDEEGDGGGGGGSGGGGGGVRRFNAGMGGLLDVGIISEALPPPSHRVQAWDFTAGEPPDIANSTKNVVVQRCRIHNDASIDISKDGRLLVALLPVPRLRNSNHWLGVYSLEWGRLGQCLHTAVLEQSAVSVALSPTARHLAVGLGSRRFTTTPHTRNNVFALLYRLDPLESSSRTGLSPIKELEQNWEQGFTSLNCLRWAPQPGQGLVYANNTGQLIVMS